MQFFSNNLNAFCRIPSSRLSLCPLSPNILLLAFWTFRYMFVISFSIFITSNEINLRNYGNIVVHCRTHMPGILFLLFQFYFSLSVFFWFDERFAYSYSRWSLCMCERVHLVFMDSGHLCCLLKMYIFHFVSIDSEPVLIQLVILMIAHLILIKFVSFFPLFCGGYRLKCKGNNTSDLSRYQCIQRTD